MRLYSGSDVALARALSRVIMRWLRLVGSLKLQVSFAKEPYNRDDILQKRPIILRSLLIVATPYVTLAQATIRRIDSIVGLFCKRALYKRLYSAKETYNLINPTNCSHPIASALSRFIMSL